MIIISFLKGGWLEKGMAKKPKKQGISRRALLTGAAIALGVAYLGKHVADEREHANRQKKLNEILLDPRLDPVRDTIEKIVYNPGFTAELEYLRELKKAFPQGDHKQKIIDRKIAIIKEAAETNKRAAKITDPYRIKEHYATTEKPDLTYFTPVKSIVFANDRMFDSPIMTSDEERASTIFHEGQHGVVNRIGFVFDEAQTRYLIRKLGKREIPAEVMADVELMDALPETQCYREQIRRIDNGEFKVNAIYRQGHEKSLQKNLDILKKYAIRSDKRGYFAQAMLANTAIDIRIPEKR